MKTKLLKKVRKRYVINYYPKQFTYCDEIYFGECMVIWDRVDGYSLEGCEIGDKHQKWFRDIKPTKEEAKALLMAILVRWIKKDYKHTRRRKSKQKVEQIWYNNHLN